MPLKSPDIPVNRFGKKYVYKLEEHSSIGEALDLMSLHNIRHLPVESGSVVRGIVNSRCMLDAVERYSDVTTLEDPLTSYICQDYTEVGEEESIFEVLRKMADHDVVILRDDNMISGILTSIDILSMDFLWYHLPDRVIQADSDLGYNINEFSCVPSESSIGNALHIMKKFDLEFIGIIDETSKTLTNVITLLDILRHLQNNLQRLDDEVDYVSGTPLHSLFPGAALYVKEPVLLSQLRKDMYMNEITLAVLLNENSYPCKIISIDDLIKYLTEYSDYLQ